MYFRKCDRFLGVTPDTIFLQLIRTQQIPFPSYKNKHRSVILR